MNINYFRKSPLISFTHIVASWMQKINLQYIKTRKGLLQNIEKHMYSLRGGDTTQRRCMGSVVALTETNNTQCCSIRSSWSHPLLLLFTVARALYTFLNETINQFYVHKSYLRPFYINIFTTEEKLFNLLQQLQ